MKYLSILLLLLSITRAANAQTPYEVSSSNTTSFAVCNIPEAGFPCSNRTTIYADAALTQVLPQPVTNIVGTLVFYIINGSAYRLQVYSGQPRQYFIYGLGNSGGATVALPFGTDVGTANSYIVNPVPAISSLTYGASFTFTTTHSNTSASTINVSGLGAKNITLLSASPLTGGEIVGGATRYQATYDGTEWLLAGTQTAGAPANPGGLLNLAGAYVVPEPSTGNTATTAGLTFIVPPGNSSTLNRSMLNFICTPLSGSGCGGTNNSLFRMGFDHDNIFIFGGAEIAFTAFPVAWEAFGQLQLETQTGDRDQFAIEPAAPQNVGTDAIHVLNFGGGATLFGLDGNNGNMFISGLFEQLLFTPSTSSQACTQGQIAWDTNFIYICTATNTWKRVALSTF